MKNSIQLVRQLKQDVFPLFCNEGVFRMLVDIFLQKQDQFQNLIQTLGDFCTAKCLKHGIGLYIRRSALEESLRQTPIFGVAIVDFNLDGMRYIWTHSRDYLS